MLNEMNGDLLNIRDGIICHQVNFHGIMGGGVAAAIAENILTDEQYQSYKDYCEQSGRTALGTVQFIGCPGGLIVANMFCQDNALVYGMADKEITNYDAMRKCLVRIRSMARLQGKQVFFPHKLGCGIAGGDWEMVKFLLKDTFEGFPEEAFIVRRAKRE